MGRLTDPTLSSRKQIEAKAKALGHELNRWRGTIADRKAFCCKCRREVYVYTTQDGIACEGSLFNDLKNEIECMGFTIQYS